MHNISIVLLSNPQIRLEAQHVPDETEYKRVANNAKVMVVNRSNPKNHYTGGDSSLTLVFEFSASTFYQRLGSISADNSQEMTALAKRDLENMVHKKAKLAESFAFGQSVKLIFGEMWKDSVWIIDSVAIAYKSHTSKRFGHLPLRATVTFNLSLNPKKSILPEDLR